MRKQIDVVILVGGLGKRMGKLTKEKPKCLLVVDDKLILTHILDNIISAFGSANVILALGYQGKKVKDFYGNNYNKINISYVHDPKNLDTKKRLLLAKDYVPSSFLLLAGDIICHPEQLVNVVEFHEKEGSFTYGTISGASWHEPALTHAIITLRDGRVTNFVFPPTRNWHPEQFRDMHVACYSHQFFGLLENAPNGILQISKVISLAVEEGKDFQASKYFKKWYHFVKPNDLNTTIDESYEE